jgi:hypothetical protein
VSLDKPVATSTAFTLAPGTTALELSVITPLIWPVCASAGLATSSARNTVASLRRIMAPSVVTTFMERAVPSAGRKRRIGQPAGDTTRLAE